MKAMTMSGAEASHRVTEMLMGILRSGRGLHAVHRSIPGGHEVSAPHLGAVWEIKGKPGGGCSVRLVKGPGSWTHAKTTSEVHATLLENAGLNAPSSRSRVSGLRRNPDKGNKQCAVCKKPRAAARKTCGSYECQHVLLHRTTGDGCDCAVCRRHRPATRRGGGLRRNEVRPAWSHQVGTPVRYQGNIYELTERTTGRKLVRIQRADMPNSIEGTRYVSVSELKPATWAEYERAAKGTSIRTPYEPWKKAAKKPAQKTPSKNPYLGNHQITSFVGKLHVSTPDHEVWQKFYAAVKRQAVAWTPLQRRQIRSAVLAAHHANQKMYRAVMRGRF